MAAPRRVGSRSLRVCCAEISTPVGDRADADEAYVTADDNDSWVCAPASRTSAIDLDGQLRFRPTVPRPAQAVGLAQAMDVLAEGLAASRLRLDADGP